MKFRLFCAAALLVSCASLPPPRVLGEVDAARGAPAIREAAQLAPQAYAHAERLRDRARAAQKGSDRAGAQILGEQAIAAYEHAVVLTRLVKAQRELSLAEQQLAKTEGDLRGLDEQQHRLASEAEDFELRIKVAREAQALATNTHTSPERELARREAATALATQARLLCTATRLLEPGRSGLNEDFGKLDELDKLLSRRAGPVPIDDAIRLRSGCLRQLSEVRRKTDSFDTGVADALLAELSAVGDLYPFRDDRGVVVTLRGIFGSGDTLTRAAEERLTALGRVARVHPNFPVLVVLHTSKASSAAEDEHHAERIAGVLRKGGAARVETRSVGSALPVADPQRSASAERNERLEIVFVSPN